MSKFENLEVWKLAHELVLEIYRETENFPNEEKFRLTDQICRASSSIAINICEGTGRKTNKDFVHFLYIARGSLQETKYQLILAKDLNYINLEKYNHLLNKCDNVSKLLNGLIKKIGGTNE